MATNTRATDPDSEGRMVQLVRAAWFQLLVPGLLTLMLALGGWYFSNLNTKIDALTATVSGMHEDSRLLDARLKTLEELRAQRQVELTGMHKEIGDLQLQVGLLRAGVKGQP